MNFCGSQCNTEERQQWFESSPEELRDITCKLDGTVADYIEKSCNSEDRGGAVMMQQGSPFVGEMKPQMISTLEEHRYKPVANVKEVKKNRAEHHFLVVSKLRQN